MKLYTCSEDMFTARMLVNCSFFFIFYFLFHFVLFETKGQQVSVKAQDAVDHLASFSLDKEDIS